MEEELRCSFCRRFFEDPVLLCCGHSYCRACAVKVSAGASSSSASSSISTRPCTPGTSRSDASFSHCLPSSGGSPLSPQSSSSASDTVSLCISDHDQESDKLSIVSESDSGVVVCSRNSHSRPPSMIGPPLASLSRLPNILTPPSSGIQVICGLCHKPTYYTDEAAIGTAPCNVAIRNVVQRYLASHPNAGCEGPSCSSPVPPSPAPPPKCDFCVNAAETATATVSCAECKYNYCAGCVETLHPNRGPFAGHKIVPAGKRMPATVASATSSEDARCSLHRAEPLTMFCTGCKAPVCCRCLQDARHANHDIQAMPTACKAHKAELTTTLSALSEKVKHAQGEIAKLKQQQDILNNNANDFKSMVCIQVDAMVEELQKRKDKLLRHVDDERDYKKRILRDQAARCNNKLQRTTALIQFCIEVLKEPDAATYLQISSALLNRSTNADFLWHSDMKTKPEVDSEIVLNLDTKHLQYAIQTLDFAQLKGLLLSSIPTRGDASRVPSPPEIDASSCSAENNSVTVVWRPRNDGCAIDGFVLELDNGREEACYKEVYSGPEMICTLDGLHFNTFYYARVKAYNSAGESIYSSPICLQTATVAWFQLTKSQSQREICLSNESHSLTATTLDYQTILGSVAFSKGVHYWEILVDRYEGNADVVVGVAKHPVNRATMLGKDLHGWSMYVDSERSWYLHNDQHHGRVAGGIRKGDSIGVRLDCDAGTLEFSINDRKRVSEHRTTIAFPNLPRFRFYPAFSVNCKTAITVHTALSLPSTPSDCE